MDIVTTLFGVGLGIGAILMWRGITTLRNPELEPDARRKGFWSLNIGLVLMAISMVAVMRLTAQSAG